MSLGECRRAAVIQDDCVHDVATESGHAPPPSWWRALCPATSVNYVVKPDTSLPAIGSPGAASTVAGPRARLSTTTKAGQRNHCLRMDLPAGTRAWKREPG